MDIGPSETGFQNGQLVLDIPVPITAELLGRGQERYGIYCAVCHGADGYGQGMIVQRGFPAPPSFHTDRLREAPAGHFFDVMTRGYGVMYPYASRVTPEDRWAIVAYIRALQFSQHAPIATVPADLQSQLSKEPTKVNRSIPGSTETGESQAQSCWSLFLILVMPGSLIWPNAFFRAYWFGLMFWTQLSIGSFDCPLTPVPDGR